jgi:MtN3 and saliva related transmembrane protein
MPEWMQNTGELFGLIAGPCTTFGFVLQVLKILRTRDTKAISLSMYIVFTFGVLCWLLYGLTLGSVAMVLFNALTLILGIIVIIAKVRFG